MSLDQLAADHNEVFYLLYIITPPPPPLKTCAQYLNTIYWRWPLFWRCNIIHQHRNYQNRR